MNIAKPKTTDEVRSMWYAWKKTFDVALEKHIEAALRPGAVDYATSVTVVVANAGRTADLALERINETWAELRAMVPR